MIQEIFALEKIDTKNPGEKRKCTLEETTEIRKKNSADKVKEFFKFCEENQGRNLPKSLTGRAISYALNQRVTLETFLKNPKIELTNNSAERAIKPFVIGRKNWLFCNTPDGADSSAIIYSVIETAKVNNLKPYDYLEYAFEMTRQGNDITDYLPYSKNVTQNLKMEATKAEE